MSPLTPSIFRSQNVPFAGKVGYLRPKKGFSGHILELPPPVLKICFGPPTAESKNLKNHVNFGVGDLFFRSPALWSSQNVFGPPTAGRVVVDIKDRVPLSPLSTLQVSFLCSGQSSQTFQHEVNFTGTCAFHVSEATDKFEN